MDSSQPPVARSAIVDRLRAAGCVFAEDESRLLVESASDEAQLESMVDARVRGLPLEHILGWAEFCGLRIAVDPGVFVPRRRTGYLVERAVRLGRKRAAAAGAPPVVVDLCCGSGAIGVAIADRLAPIELYAADIDPRAAVCARRNIEPAGGQVFEGDLFDALPPALKGRIDILAVNAPYVPTDAISLMPPEARLHEASVALDGGADGLDVHRRVASHAAEWLARGGHLLVEVNERQAGAATAVFEQNGLTPRVVTSKKFGATVVIATR